MNREQNGWQREKVTKGILEVNRKTGCKIMKLVAGIFTRCGKANNKQDTVLTLLLPSHAM